MSLSYGLLHRELHIIWYLVNALYGPGDATVSPSEIELREVPGQWTGQFLLVGMLVGADNLDPTLQNQVLYLQIAFAFDDFSE